MAEAVGKDDEAKAWRETAEYMKKGIEGYMLRPETNKWSFSIGFLHDPVLSMLADVYGFDRG
jgi:GH15 family glucan-1,4-alpha-glucosidase